MSINEPCYNRPSLEEMLHYAEELGDLRSALNKCKNYFQVLKVFREYYLLKEEYFIEAYNRNPFLWASSYPIDWSIYFTAIEFHAWITIRAKGGIVLYPQYPALNYHLDFANPGCKIGLELDGKDFHCKERDYKRDTELHKEGWTIYRIPGTEMMKTDFTTLSELNREYGLSQAEIESKLEDWLLHTGDGVIEAIRFVHFQSKAFTDFPEDSNFKHFEYLCHATLQRHTYKNQ